MSSLFLLLTDPTIERAIVRPDQIAAVARLNAALLLRDPGPLLAYVTMPVLLMFFLAPLYGLSAHNSAGGNAQAVTGMVVMFAMFTINVMGTSFFAEHGSRTWDRLRSTPATRLELMCGKALPLYAVLAVQSTTIFAVGLSSFRVSVRGSLFVLVAVVGVYQLSVLALGLLLIAAARTRGQLGVLADVGGMLSACLGGALVPASALPRWALPASPLVPSHWAMRGIMAMVVNGSLSEAGEATAILLGFAALFLVLARSLFRRFDRRSL